MDKIQKIWDQSWQDLLTTPSPKMTRQWNKITSVLKTVPKTFLDIGPGKFGSEAWDVKKACPNCKIIGFEPQPERFKLLQKHNYPGTLLPFVISDADGVVKGYMGYKGGKADFWLFGIDDDVLSGAYKEVNIMSYTLDKLEENYGPFDDAFIWADIEGSELSALRGAGRLFDENKIVGVNVELRNSPIRTGACTANEIDEFLRSKKFDPVGKIHIPKGGHRDIIFIPNTGR